MEPTLANFLDAICVILRFIGRQTEADQIRELLSFAGHYGVKTTRDLTVANNYLAVAEHRPQRPWEAPDGT